MTQEVGAQNGPIFFAWDKIATPLGVEILSYVQETNPAKTCRIFSAFSRQFVCNNLWREGAKNTAIAELQVDVLFYNPSLNVTLQGISKCFAKLLERQRAYCPTYQAEFDEVQRKHPSSLSLKRFTEGQRYVNQERDDNLVKLWGVIKERIARLSKDFGTDKMRRDAATLEVAYEIRAWMQDPDNQTALLSKITQLDVSHNDLSEIPREILLLKGLEPEKLTIDHNPLRRISPELVPYIALNMPSLCDREDKKAPLSKLGVLEEIPFRLWFRQNYMPGETYQKIVETIGECLLRLVGFLMIIPGALIYFVTTALPAFLLNQFTMHIIEPVVAYFRNFLGYSPTIDTKK